MKYVATAIFEAPNTYLVFNAPNTVREWIDDVGQKNGKIVLYVYLSFNAPHGLTKDEIAGWLNKNVEIKSATTGERAEMLTLWTVGKKIT